MKAGVLGAILVLTLASPAAAQENRIERIEVGLGAAGAVIKNRITGYQTVDYLLAAEAGQRLKVVLDTDNPSNYFNVIAPGADQAMHVGPVAGSRFEAELPSTGDYTIRVFLMRNAARRDESASYTLALHRYEGGPPVPASRQDRPDGPRGGPEF